MEHPWKLLIEAIKDRGWTQKQFSSFVWKKNSEVNELIKGKRNITVQWDLILSKILWTPEKYWINLQVDYDYNLAKIRYEEEMNNLNEEGPVLVWSDGKEIQDNNNPQNISNKALPEEIQPIEKEQVQETQNKSDETNKTQVDQWQIQVDENQEKRREIKKIWRDF
jgi:plasmid maintenance system antidote protein VapI